MCGIVGFCDFNKKISNKILKDMTDELVRRGPDDSGYKFYENEYANIGLGHRRLSILDLTKHGHQPMNFDHLEIIYNGEVYNFKEIRRELERENYAFNSDSDTEVILKAYHRWGIKAVDKFNGMFSICIYDKSLQKIILIRDRVGVKPLFWFWDKNIFMFASEIKSFHKNPCFKKEIDNDGLFLYFEYGYIKQPYTIFKNCYKLESGKYIEFDIIKKEVNQYGYWDINKFYESKLDISETDAISELDKLMKSSFSYRMISDVPVGVFLSGGYDSSAVAALLQSNITSKLKTFTIGFYEENYNEANYAKKVANYLGTDHTEYYCTQSDASKILQLLPEIYDEPFGDSSAIATVLVSQLAKKDVSVALSADGGDELFGGYELYTKSINQYEKFSQTPYILKKILDSMINKIPLEDFFKSFKIYNFEGKLNKFRELLNMNNLEEVYDINSKYFQKNEVMHLLRKEYMFIDILGKNSLDSLLCKSFKEYLQEDILTKVDRATMSVSLEGREPLLDYRLIEFVAKLPEQYKIKNGERKYILKQIVHKYIPIEIMKREKMGFSIPIFEWFKDELKQYIDYYLEDERIKKEGIFNIHVVKKVKNDYLHGNGNPYKIWLLVNFEMWRERWMND